MDVSRKRFFNAFWVVSFSALIAAQAANLSSSHAASNDPASSDPDADYDRLDGTGASGKKVNVIEWEGNLEIHVYPAGSLKGLALKLDKKNKDKPVMVIGYRFDNNPGQQLIRRAILGIDLREGFKAYRDTSADGYDKIVISNSGLSLAQYKLDPPPTQLYPDGHPALKDPKKAVAKSDADETESRKPANNGSSAGPSSDDLEQARQNVEMMQDSGTIRPFLGSGSGSQLGVHPKANH